MVDSCTRAVVALGALCPALLGQVNGLKAISLLHDFPIAHFQLGAMLSRLGWLERAMQAFDICLAMRPDFALAHRYVSLISQRLGDTQKSAKHREIAKRILAEGLPQPQVE